MSEVFIAPDPSFFIIACGIVSLFWAGFNFNIIKAVSLDEVLSNQSSDRTVLTSGSKASEAQMALVREVYNAVRVGANAFLRAEYTICAQFVFLFGILILFLIGW